MAAQFAQALHPAGVAQEDQERRGVADPGHGREWGGQGGALLRVVDLQDAGLLVVGLGRCGQGGQAQQVHQGLRHRAVRVAALGSPGQHGGNEGRGRHVERRRGGAETVLQGRGGWHDREVSKNQARVQGGKAQRRPSGARAGARHGGRLCAFPPHSRRSVSMLTTALLLGSLPAFCLALVQRATRRTRSNTTRSIMRPLHDASAPCGLPAPRWPILLPSQIVECPALMLS